MRQPLLDRPSRVAVVCVLVAGSGLAISGLVAALVHDQWRPATAYVAVTVALIAGAVLVWRQVRWVTIVCLVGMAGQCVAVAGTVWELTHPSVNAKALQLTAIGIDPTTATTINLVYSAAAFGVFGWIAARRWMASRDRESARQHQPVASDADKQTVGEPDRREASSGPQPPTRSSPRSASSRPTSNGWSTTTRSNDTGVTGH
jgi:hypothetical protein